jgi:hypothetical protein
VFIASRTLLPRMHAESPFMHEARRRHDRRRMRADALAADLGKHDRSATTGGTLVSVLLPLFLIDTRKWHKPDRPLRVSFGKIFGAARCARSSSRP